MPMSCLGLAKLIEECGELLQVLGKRLAYYHTNKHPDGGPPLNTRMEEEVGDVLAACRFVQRKFRLSEEAINLRATKKLMQFERWDAEPDNNRDAIDGDRAALGRADETNEAQCNGNCFLSKKIEYNDKYSYPWHGITVLAVGKTAANTNEVTK